MNLLVVLYRVQTGSGGVCEGKGSQGLKIYRIAPYKFSTAL